MKVYKVSYMDTWDEHQGYSYHRKRTEAQLAAKKFEDQNENHTTEIEECHVRVSAEGVIAALNRHGSHNDNG